MLKSSFPILLFLLITSLSTNSYGQDARTIDSLRKEIKKNNLHDTTRIQLLCILSETTWDLRISLWDSIANLAYKAEKKHTNKKVIRNLQASRAGAINNIGFIYERQGDYGNALKYYHKSLKIHEKINERSGISNAYNNIGAIYQSQDDIKLALEYYNKSLKIREEDKDLFGMAMSYNNFGAIYQRLDKDSLAMEYYLKSLNVRKTINDKHGMAYTYNNIASINEDKNRNDFVLENYNKSLQLRKEINDKYGIAECLISIGRIELANGNIKRAQNYADTGTTIAYEIANPTMIKRSAELRGAIAVKKGDFKLAFEMRNLEIQMRDSLAGEEAVKATTQQQAKYEYEKQQAITNARHEKKLALEQKEKEQQQFVTYAVVGILLLVLAFLVFIFNRLKITRKQKEEIDQQKKEIEKTHQSLAEHHKDIQDSIIYAKRIQEAILPSRYSLAENLKNGFVLYKPKDIVAGDFYWLEKHNNAIYVAAADCTGHGVPGAMVSVVCSNALSKALLEEGITDTGKILDRTRELVVEKFSKSGENVKDGMDISLLKINENTNQLQWSGANNPLWLIKKSTSTNQELIEFKPDKQPIGMFAEPKPFQTISIDVNPGDTLYLLTDGYEDQFGGDPSTRSGGKKFKAAKMKELFLSIQDKTMEDQKEIINQTFEDWKGEFEQVDDVCVIGIRL